MSNTKNMNESNMDNAQRKEKTINVLAIIPARGGSKGIKQKNIRPLLCKPLIEYSIIASLHSHAIRKTIVSTDDAEIAEISINAGAEIINRPEQLATDEAKSIDVIFHCLEILKKKRYVPEILLLLQPTSPCRSSEDIDTAIDLFIKSGADSVVSVCEMNHSPFWSFKINNDNLVPLFNEKYLKKRRQELPLTYMPNGAIYISTPAFLHKTKDFFSGKIIPYIMPQIRSIDIDTEFDLLLAENYLKEQK